MAWWRDGVLYQIYPRSFADADGDGVGDLQGIIGRLDHLQWLGVDGIWLSPIHPSPNRDWGYDVADYTGVHPDLGTLDDVDELVAEARRRDIRILLDLVPNHSSDRHPWFVESRSSRDSPRRDWYVWTDEPSNWISVFGGSAWTLDEATGQYYLHNFMPEQPDLNWWSGDVRDEFDRILRFWFDRGVAGFRIDVAHALVHDRELRDNTPAGPDDDERLRRFGQRFDRSMNQPEVHDVYRRWRALADTYEEPPVLLGETYVMKLDRMASFYGTGDDQLHLAFNFAFVHAPFEVEALREIVEGTEAALPPDAWPVWTGSNHDVARFPTRWCHGDERLGRCALVMLLTLRGTPVLYYGDELLLENVDVPPEAVRDPVALRRWADERGRDGSRTPMPWEPGDGYGFTRAGVQPWLPFGAHEGRKVAEQREDPASPLRLTRDLLALRRARGDLHAGAYETLDAPEDVWAWRRGEQTAVALNLSAGPVELELEGTVLLATERDRDGEAVGPLRLDPAEAVVLDLPGAR
jgi:alpha-glucosidase